MTTLSETLRRLEKTWLRNGMPHTEWMAPGLTHDETQRLLAAEGLPAPGEILDWFEWHNGSVSADDVRPRLGPSGFEPLSLTESFARRSMMVEVASEIDSEGQVADEDRPLWHAHWVPVGCDVGGELLTADLSAPDSAALPVRAVDFEDPDGLKIVRAPSLAAVAEFWIDVLDKYCRWSPETRSWEYDYAALPLEVRLSGLL